MDHEFLVAAVFFLLGLVAFALYQEHRRIQRTELLLKTFSNAAMSTAQFALGAQAVAQLDNRLRELAGILRPRRDQ